MDALKKKVFILNGSIVFCFLILAIILQSHLFLNWDVRWLLSVTQKWMQGGHYGSTFFETSPPFILLTYAPVVLLKTHTNFSWQASFLLYTFFCILVSLALIYTLIAKIWQKQYVFQTILLGSLSFVLFILPYVQFGQREHFVIFLILPYLFLVLARLEKCSISPVLVVIIAILAALGFAIKPYFILIFVSVELFYFFRSKKMLSVFRLETILIVNLLILGFLWTVLFFKDFIHKVLPIVWTIYYAGTHNSWHELIFSYSVFFVFLICLAYFFCRRFFTKKTFSDLLIIASLTSLFCYFWQRTVWFYHIYPAISFAWVLMTLMLYWLFLNFRKYSIRGAICLLINLVALFSMLAQSILSYNYYLQVKKIFLYQDKKVKFINKRAKKQTIFVFSTTVPATYSIIQFAPFKPVSRFPSLFLLPGLLKLEKQNHSSKKLMQLASYKNELFQMIYEDLAKQPQWLMVDMSANKVHLRGIELNYLAYFSKDSRIRAEFKKYQHVKTIGHYAFYHRIF